MNKLLYTRPETAHKLSLSLRTVDHLIAAKRLKAIRVGKRVLVSEQALAQFARRDHTEVK